LLTSQIGPQADVQAQIASPTYPLLHPVAVPWLAAVGAWIVMSVEPETASLKTFGA
jgi:hypothetical protein